MISIILLAIGQIFLAIAIIFVILIQRDMRNSMHNLANAFRELSGKNSHGEKNGKSTEN